MNEIEIGGIKYREIEQHVCTNCAFTKNGACTAPELGTPSCASGGRPDGKSVIFFRVVA